MTRSSFAVRNVVSAFRKHLKAHHPIAPLRDADQSAAPDFVGIEGPIPTRVLRERFGNNAVREFRSASLEDRPGTPRRP